MEKKLRTLIVDGDIAEAEILEERLKEEFEVVGAVFDGVKAIEEITTQTPDVVLVDIMLPHIDGIGVIEKCREQIAYDQLPVFIVLTSIGTEKLIECINHMDVDYCMMRPFKKEVLIHRIKQVAKIKGLDQKIRQRGKEQRLERRKQKTVLDYEFNMKQDVTKIIIAQRVTSVMNTDQIIILDDGKIHRIGTHAELLADDPIYQEIYASQMKGGDENGSESL